MSILPYICRYVFFLALSVVAQQSSFSSSSEESEKITSAPSSPPPSTSAPLTSPVSTPAPLFTVGLNGLGWYTHSGLWLGLSLPSETYASASFPNDTNATTTTTTEEPTDRSSHGLFGVMPGSGGKSATDNFELMRAGLSQNIRGPFATTTDRAHNFKVRWKREIFYSPVINGGRQISPWGSQKLEIQTVEQAELILGLLEHTGLKLPLPQQTHTYIDPLVAPNGISYLNPGATDQVSDGLRTPLDITDPRGLVGRNCSDLSKELKQIAFGYDFDHCTFRSTSIYKFQTGYAVLILQIQFTIGLVLLCYSVWLRQDRSWRYLLGRKNRNSVRRIETSILQQPMKFKLEKSALYHVRVKGDEEDDFDPVAIFRRRRCTNMGSPTVKERAHRQLSQQRTADFGQHVEYSSSPETNDPSMRYNAGKTTASISLEGHHNMELSEPMRYSQHQEYYSHAAWTLAMQQQNQFDNNHTYQEMQSQYGLQDEQPPREDYSNAEQYKIQNYSRLGGQQTPESNASKKLSSVRTLSFGSLEGNDAWITNPVATPTKGTLGSFNSSEVLNGQNSMSESKRSLAAIPKLQHVNATKNDEGRPVSTKAEFDRVKREKKRELDRQLREHELKMAKDMRRELRRMERQDVDEKTVLYKSRIRADPYAKVVGCLEPVRAFSADRGAWVPFEETIVTRLARQITKNEEARQLGLEVLLGQIGPTGDRANRKAVHRLQKKIRLPDHREDEGRGSLSVEWRWLTSLKKLVFPGFFKMNDMLRLRLPYQKDFFMVTCYLILPCEVIFDLVTFSIEEGRQEFIYPGFNPRNAMAYFLCTVGFFFLYYVPLFVSLAENSSFSNTIVGFWLFAHCFNKATYVVLCVTDGMLSSDYSYRLLASCIFRCIILVVSITALLMGPITAFLRFRARRIEQLQAGQHAAMKERLVLRQKETEKYEKKLISRFAPGSQTQVVRHSKNIDADSQDTRGNSAYRMAAELSNTDFIRGRENVVSDHDLVLPAVDGIQCDPGSYREWVSRILLPENHCFDGSSVLDLGLEFRSRDLWRQHIYETHIQYRDVYRLLNLGSLAASVESQDAEENFLERLEKAYGIIMIKKSDLEERNQSVLDGIPPEFSLPTTLQSATGETISVKSSVEKLMLQKPLSPPRAYRTHVFHNMQLDWIPDAFVYYMQMFSPSFLNVNSDGITQDPRYLVARVEYLHKRLLATVDSPTSIKTATSLLILWILLPCLFLHFVLLNVTGLVRMALLLDESSSSEVIPAIEHAMYTLFADARLLDTGVFFYQFKTNLFGRESMLTFTGELLQTLQDTVQCLIYALIIAGLLALYTQIKSARNGYLKHLAILTALKKGERGDGTDGKRRNILLSRVRDQIRDNISTVDAWRYGPRYSAFSVAYPVSAFILSWVFTTVVVWGTLLLVYWYILSPLENFIVHKKDPMKKDDSESGRLGYSSATNTNSFVDVMLNYIWILGFLMWFVFLATSLLISSTLRRVLFSKPDLARVLTNNPDLNMLVSVKDRTPRVTSEAEVAGPKEERVELAGGTKATIQNRVSVASMIGSMLTPRRLRNAGSVEDSENRHTEERTVSPRTTQGLQDTSISSRNRSNELEKPLPHLHSLREAFTESFILLHRSPHFALELLLYLPWFLYGILQHLFRSLSAFLSVFKFFGRMDVDVRLDEDDFNGNENSKRSSDAARYVTLCHLALEYRDSNAVMITFCQLMLLETTGGLNYRKRVIAECDPVSLQINRDTTETPEERAIRKRKRRRFGKSSRDVNILDVKVEGEDAEEGESDIQGNIFSAYGVIGQEELAQQGQISPTFQGSHGMMYTEPGSGYGHMEAYPQGPTGPDLETVYTTANGPWFRPNPNEVSSELLMTQNWYDREQSWGCEENGMISDFVEPNRNVHETRSLHSDFGSTRNQSVGDPYRYHDIRQPPIVVGNRILAKSRDVHEQLAERRTLSSAYKAVRQKQARVRWHVAMLRIQNPRAFMVNYKRGLLPGKEGCLDTQQYSPFLLSLFEARARIQAIQRDRKVREARSAHAERSVLRWHKHELRSKRVLAERQRGEIASDSFDFMYRWVYMPLKMLFNPPDNDAIMREKYEDAALEAADGGPSKNGLAPIDPEKSGIVTNVFGTNPNEELRNVSANLVNIGYSQVSPQSFPPEQAAMETQKYGEYVAYANAPETNLAINQSPNLRSVAYSQIALQRMQGALYRQRADDYANFVGADSLAVVGENGWNLYRDQASVIEEQRSQDSLFSNTEMDVDRMQLAQQQQIQQEEKPSDFMADVSNYNERWAGSSIGYAEDWQQQEWIGEQQERDAVVGGWQQTQSWMVDREIAGFDGEKLNDGEPEYADPNDHYGVQRHTAAVQAQLSSRSHVSNPQLSHRSQPPQLRSNLSNMPESQPLESPNSQSKIPPPPPKSRSVAALPSAAVDRLPHFNSGHSLNIGYDTGFHEQDAISPHPFRIRNGKPSESKGSRPSTDNITMLSQPKTAHALFGTKAHSGTVSSDIEQDTAKNSLDSTAKSEPDDLSAFGFGDAFATSELTPERVEEDVRTRVPTKGDVPKNVFHYA